jgi:zinc-binding in reverse transcriptase
MPLKLMAPNPFSLRSLTKINKNKEKGVNYNIWCAWKILKLLIRFWQLKMTVIVYHLTAKKNVIHQNDETIKMHEIFFMTVELRIWFLFFVFWDLHLLLKIKCFIWLVLQNKILIRDNLSRRGWRSDLYILSFLWGDISYCSFVPILSSTKRILEFFLMHKMLDIFFYFWFPWVLWVSARAL